MHVALEAVQDSLSNRPTNSKYTFAHRLLCKTDFDRVIQTKNLADKFIKVYFAPNDLVNARLGIIASKKVLPRSVDRNRLRRLIREVFRHHNIKYQNLDIVVMARLAFSRKSDFRTNNLERLFTLVENKCVKS